MRGAALILLLAACGTLVPARGTAQTAAELVERATRAYERFALDTAAGLIRRALDQPGDTSLTTDGRAGALSLLATAELFRDRRDSAVAAFRRLVLLAPRYRPDPAIFAPPVLALFDTVRAATPVVGLQAPAETTIVAQRERFTARLYASTTHQITAVVLTAGGRPVLDLYRGPIGDSLVLDWTGVTSDGRPVGRGGYLLAVTSRDEAGATLREVRLPLEIAAERPDTLPHPEPVPDSLLRPERLPAAPGIRALATGLVVGGAAATLPALLDTEPATGARFVVGGAVSLAGIVGFFRQRPGTPLPHNIAVNDSLRADRTRRLAEVLRHNAPRRDVVRLTIATGPVLRIERERP